MMKKVVLASLLLMVFVGSIAAVQGQTDEEIAMNLLRTSEKIFPRILIDEKFSEKDPPEFYFEPDHYAMIYQYQNESLFHTLYNETPEHGYVGMSAFWAGNDYGTLSDFHFRAETSLVSEFPEDTGGCYVQYTNLSVVGPNNRKSIQVSPGHAIKMDNHNSILLKDLQQEQVLGKKVIVDIIRLEGIAYIFIDGVFQVLYQDGIQETLSWMVGTETSENGEQAACVIDNILVRRK